MFPLLKAAPEAGLDKLFFLAAKGPGRALALQALDTLNAQPAAPGLRVLELQARDKLCEHPDKACHGESCPLARGFYDRLPQARAGALAHGRMDAAALRQVAAAHDVCPYYLAQELTRWSDVVVGDYNYYDATAMLHALTQASQWKVAVLADEAHNLVDRARRMYTAELSQATLAGARQAAPKPLKKALDGLHRSWQAFNRKQAEPYQAYDAPPAGVLAALQKATAAITEALAEMPLAQDDPVLAFHFEALHFQRLAELYGPHALFDATLAQPGAAGAKTPLSTLCVRNVIPAPHLAGRFATAHATVLFSGTLSPPRFFQDTLGLPAATDWIDVAAPFRAEQLDVRVAGHVHALPRPRAFARAHRGPDRQSVRQPAGQLPGLPEQLRLSGAGGRADARAPSAGAGLAADAGHGRGGPQGVPGAFHGRGARRGLRGAGRRFRRGRGPARQAADRRLHRHAGAAAGQSGEREHASPAGRALRPGTRLRLRLSVSRHAEGGAGGRPRDPHGARQRHGAPDRRPLPPRQGARAAAAWWTLR